jgi:TonB family protein
MRRLAIAATLFALVLFARAQLHVRRIAVQPGVMQGNTYVNASLGISYPLPEGWTGVATPPATGAAAHEFELLRAFPAAAPEGPRMLKLSVVAQKDLPDDQQRDPARFLVAGDAARRGVRNDGVERVQLRAPFGVDVDGHPFQRAEWKLGNGAPILYETQVAGVLNGHMLLLSVLSPVPAEAGELADSADDLKFSPPAEPAEETVPPAVIHKNEAPVKRVSVPENVMRAHLRAKVDPAYPSEALDRGVEGDVTLDVVVAADGSVADVTVLSGHPLLNDAALVAVRQWKFDAADGERETLIRITFSLSSARQSS